MMVFLLVAGVFVVLYLAATYIKPLGGCIRFVAELVAKPLNRIEENLAVFKQKPPSGDVKYPGLRTLVVQGFLVLASIALSADTYGSLQALTALLGGAVGLPALPSFFTYSLAALFVSTSAICGGLWLEEVLPVEARVFNQTADVNQGKKFRRLISAGFWLSLVASFLYFALRPFFIANPESGTTHALQVLVFLLLGALLPIVGSLCLFLVAMGFQTILVLVARIGLLIITTLSDVCAFLISHFGENTQVANTSASSSSPALAPVPAVSPALESEVFPEMTEKLVALTFDDQFGSHMIAPTKTAVDRLAARFLIRSSGRVGFLTPATPRPGIGVDTSPMQRMAKRKEQWAHMAEQIITAHDGVSTLPAPLLHFLDCSHGDAATAMLEPLSRRVPGASHLVITACAETDLNLAHVQEFFTSVLQIPHTTIVRVDPTSDFAKTQGFPKLCTFIADTLVKLLLSPKQSSFNLSAVELVERFGQVSRVMKLSFAVAPAVPGKTPVRGFWLKLFTDKATSGSYADALAQALSIAREVVPSGGLPSYLLFSCPFGDNRYHRFVAENNQQVIQALPGTLTGAVAASGVSPLHPESTSPFFVSVAAFTPDLLPVQSLQKAGKPTEEKQAEKQAAGSKVLPADMQAETLVVTVPATKTASPSLNGKSNGRGRPRSGTKSRTSTKKGK